MSGWVKRFEFVMMMVDGMANNKDETQGGRKDMRSVFKWQQELVLSEYNNGLRQMVLVKWQSSIS